MIDPHERQDPNECPRCRAAVPPGAAECPACAPAGNGSTEAAPGSVYALLSASNLARMRGQWDEAVAKCVEVLRLDPNSPTAHSLIGDIYQDQGRREEAIQWYEMALDLDPANTADRTKLERLLHPEVTTSVPVRPPLWVRIGIPAALVLAFLMMVVGVGTFLSSKQRNPAPVSTDDEPPAIEIPSDLRPPSRRATPPRSAPRPVPSVAVSVMGETARERKLRQGLNFRPEPDGSAVQVAEVQVDPGAESATVTLYSRPRREVQTDALVRWAADAASQAYRIDGYLQSCKVRVLSPTMGGAAPDVALIAGSGRNQALAATSPGGVFSSVWWNPAFFPDAPLPPSTPSSERPSASAPIGSGTTGAPAAPAAPRPPTSPAPPASGTTEGAAPPYVPGNT
jgi:hypothetical protein